MATFAHPLLPITGAWPWGAEHPEIVSLVGRTFRLARWRGDYKDVVAQYREDVPRESMHLKVRADGSYLIDHIDAYNPDCGAPARHFFYDHPVGRFAKNTIAPSAAFALFTKFLFRA